jgi:hypothetical protein
MECKKDELITSFDGASFHFPHEITNWRWYKNKVWLHTDQSFKDNDFKCVQSCVTAYDVNKYDATLTFLQKNHLYHKEFSNTFNIKNSNNWYKLNSHQINFYLQKCCKQKYIKFKSEYIVLWDSWTIHSGTQPFKQRKYQNFRNIVCY